MAVPTKENTMRELPTPTFDLSTIALPRGLLHRHTPEVSATMAAPPASKRQSLEVSWARHTDDIRQAQRLRYRVFAEEMGARLDSPEPGLDIDLFDPYCEHLLVRDAETREVIGTYRVLTSAQVKRVGSTYSDTEFDLTRLRPSSTM